MASEYARQQLRRYRAELAAFEHTFGDPDIAVSEFAADAGSDWR